MSGGYAEYGLREKEYESPALEPDFATESVRTMRIIQNRCQYAHWACRTEVRSSVHGTDQIFRLRSRTLGVVQMREV